MRWCVRAAVCLALLVNVTYGQCAGKNTQVDLEIVIDNSDGVTQADYDRIRSLSISFINEQEDGSSLSTLHAGVIVVGNGIDLRTAISNDHSQTASSFLNIDYAGSFRHTTSTGIEVAFNDLVTKVSPSNTRKVMIVFASKTSTDTEGLTFSAGFARQVGIEVFPVALNGFDTGAGSEIELMAGASNRDRIRIMANPASATSFPDVDLNLCGVGDPTVAPTVPTVPTTQPTVPTTRPTIPTTQPTIPTTRPTIPTTQPTIPTTRPTIPTTQPTIPTTRPTIPTTTTRPTIPTTQPTIPTTRPTIPTTRPTIPTTTTRPTIPTTRPTIPTTTTRPTVPTTQRTVPTTRRTVPTVPTTRRTVPTTRRTVPTIPTTRATRPTIPTVPTTTLPPTTTTTTTTTLRPLQEGSICENSVVILGVGLSAVPLEPESYVVCYYPPVSGGRRRRQAVSGVEAITFGVTGALAIKKTCPFGSFWNQAARSCAPAGSFTASQDDPCHMDRSLGSRAAINNCRGYYACVNRQSVPVCCPVGQTYTKFGCIACPGCSDSCTAARITANGLVSSMTVSAADQCYKQPKWDDSSSYVVVKAGPTFVTVACPDGEYFNLAGCGCQANPWRNASQPTCTADISAPTFFNAINGVTLNQNVQLSQFGEAMLVGQNSKISINVDDNTLMQTGTSTFDRYDADGTVVIQFRYRELSEITFRQALLSTPVECDQGNLLVTVDREDVTVEVENAAGGWDRLKLPTAGFKPNEWKTLRLVDNRDVMTLSITDGSDAYVTRTVASAGPYIKCGLDLGYNAYTKGFKGFIDQLSFYQCIPNNIAA